MTKKKMIEEIKKMNNVISTEELKKMHKDIVFTIYEGYKIGR